MNKHRVMVVDDEVSIQKVLSFDLKKKGYDVETAGSGEEALTKLKASDFDLIITDLNMEGMTGLELMKECKSLKPGTRLMLLTAYGSMSTAIEALRLGADDYLLKPYDRSEMFIRVSNCLDKLELQRKVRLYENILTVCCVCQKIQDDTGKSSGEGDWIRPDEYLQTRTTVETSHSYCPKCYEHWMQEIENSETRNPMG